MGWFRRTEPEPKVSFEPQPKEESHAITQGDENDPRFCTHPGHKPTDRVCGRCGTTFRIYQAE